MAYSFERAGISSEYPACIRGRALAIAGEERATEDGKQRALPNAKLRFGCCAALKKLKLGHIITALPERVLLAEKCPTSSLLDVRWRDDSVWRVTDPHLARRVRAPHRLATMKSPHSRALPDAVASRRVQKVERQCWDASTTLSAAGAAPFWHPPQDTNIQSSTR